MHEEVDDGRFEVLLSDRLLEIYSSVKEAMEVAGFVSINQDLYPEVISSLFELLKLDVGYMNLGVLALLVYLFQQAELLTIRGYEVISTPARYGEMRYGMTSWGQAHYRIEPEDFDA